jgi:hypothetical protein
MGLDTTHDCFHGAYSAFSRWRNAVAEAAGYLVAPVKWPGLGYEADSVLIDWGHVEEKNYAGEWDEIPSDPLMILIVHSDCDGKILPEHTTPLADRLAEILPLMTCAGGGHIERDGGYQRVTQRFIEGLRAAAGSGEAVRFY